VVEQLPGWKSILLIVYLLVSGLCALRRAFEVP
jgi:hypothetical protein